MLLAAAMIHPSRGTKSLGRLADRQRSTLTDQAILESARVVGRLELCVDGLRPGDLKNIFEVEGVPLSIHQHQDDFNLHLTCRLRQRDAGGIVGSLITVLGNVGNSREVIVRFLTNLAVTALAVGLVAPAPAWAWTSPGCTNLPEYERALGALQGMTSACDMSVEKANRIVAAQGYRPGGIFGTLLSNPPRPVAEPAPISGYSQGRTPSPYHRSAHHGAAHRREAVAR